MGEQNAGSAMYNELLNILGGDEQIGIESLLGASSNGPEANTAGHPYSQSSLASSICSSCAIELRELLNRILLMFSQNYVPLIRKVHNCETMVSASHEVILEIRDRVNKISPGTEEILMVPTPADKVVLSSLGCDNEGSAEELVTSHSNKATRILAPTATLIMPEKHLTNELTDLNRRGKLDYWSRGIGKVASTGSSSRKRSLPLAEAQDNDADRFKKTKDIDDSIACTVLAGIERSNWVTGITPYRKGPVLEKNRDDYLVYRSGPLGQPVQNPNETQIIPLGALQICCFVFHDKLDDKANHMSEVLFKAGKFEISREQFHSVKPGKVIDAEILTGACVVASRLSAQALVIKQWFLPWTFARDVLRDLDEFEIMHYDEKAWMPITYGLLRVIIPIIDKDGTWFLMFFDIKRRRVYSLDVSRTTQTKKNREKLMEKIMKFMGGVFKKDRNIANFSNSIGDFRQWEYFLYPKGLPSNIASMVPLMDYASQCICQECSRLRDKVNLF
ncbi:hypothetical protein PIB30_089317 [Stylosanthes scabra]|uniref:Uncharacterized protein n=1 Tax=Stylosanthes scabra TaxID=79078 RepID=A0ABU6XT10_9FABA|nr:hypothetical protein [Stylosanthes scabra]